MILVGLTGTHGAGKGTVVEYLVREHGFTPVLVSEFLAQEAERRGLEPDRPARQGIANSYREESPKALMEATFAGTPQGVERVILEPQYTVDEVQFIHDKGGVVIAVDADLRVRYDRVHVRGSKKDDVSFEVFVAMQELSSQDKNKQNVLAAMAAADIHLTNNGTVEEFEQSIQNFLEGRNLL